MSLVLSGDTGVQGNSGAFVAGTAVASTSGTSIDFTSIPSWVKRITVMFAGVSLNGSSAPLIQLGDSGGVETTGYLSASSYTTGATGAAISSTAGFPLNTANSAGNTNSGSIVLTLLNSSTNLWTCAATLCFDNVAYVIIAAGQKSLSGTLDRVRVTTVNGTDAYDAGSINILYE